MAGRPLPATRRAVKLVAAGSTYAAAANRVGIAVSTLKRACALAGVKSQHKAGGYRRKP